MSSPEPLTLVLVGPMGSGKTSVGRRVAKMLSVGFVDTDKRIVAAHGPIPEIFTAHGEAYFRALEAAAVADALSEGGVVSVGGGAVASVQTRELLREHPVVLLTVTPESVRRRLSGGGRPLLAGDDDPITRWNEIYEQRRGWYEEVADATFDTSHRPMQHIAEEIAAWRREQA
ncbi:shikimate kinase [Microbacterium aerolatum]|uniref:Shikimate kinase n=1 Tax=Microbacterium aerolatum TaxID=153731 RepID=A0A511ACZ9_9MICO|nr:shikimate kinase [Microbacterium aerolatum]GEK86045.1 shikimate kinase [Microbacterium aerolatum]GGB27305.1 shikimate kinase [Microbacterium aerolatum]